MARGLEHFTRRENAALRFCWRATISPHRLPEATRRRAFCKAERLCEVHTVAARTQSRQTDRWRRFRNRKISAKSARRCEGRREVVEARTMEGAGGMMAWHGGCRTGGGEWAGSVVGATQMQSCAVDPGSPIAAIYAAQRFLALLQQITNPDSLRGLNVRFSCTDQHLFTDILAVRNERGRNKALEWPRIARLNGRMRRGTR